MSAGLAKCLGAGLRIAYVVVPDVRSGLAFRRRGADRDRDGFARHRRARDPLDRGRHRRRAARGAVRRESIERQRLAAAILPPGSFRADPIGFHLWVSLPPSWTRSAFVGHMRSTGIGVVASDAFATDATPPEAVRVCLGGPVDRNAVRSALEYMAHALPESPALASTFL